jgi:carbon storage regulator
MLVLSRRRGEGVTIGPDVRIVVLGIKGGQVRLGIEAPPNVEVHRDEVHARIQEENRIAARPDVIPLEAFRQLSNKMTRRGA